MNEGAAKRADHALPEGFPRFDDKPTAMGIDLAAAPGYGEVFALIDQSPGEADPALAGLFSAATAGVAPAGPDQRRAPIHMARPAAAGPEPKGYLCAQDGAFNLHAARQVAPNERQRRELPCRYDVTRRLELGDGGGRTGRLKEEQSYGGKWRGASVTGSQPVNPEGRSPCGDESGPP